eukprot:gene5868-8093_t
MSPPEHRDLRPGSWVIVKCKVTVTSTSNQYLANNQRKYMRKLDYDNLVDNVRKNTKKNSIVVIKYGGHAMDNNDLKELFFQDIATLCSEMDIIPVIVHGGGPQIAKMLKELKIESKFVNGLRVTDQPTLEVAQMVLCGSINKEISAALTRRSNVRGALGLSGLDSRLITARQKDVSLGLVGEPHSVNTALLSDLIKMRIIPVIAPIGTNEDGNGGLNINADTAAGAVAEALKADVFLLLTDIVGVLNKDKVLIETIRSSEVNNLMEDGTVSGGMIPKLQTASQAVNSGVGMVAIADGRSEHCVLKALSNEVFGTRVVN